MNAYSEISFEELRLEEIKDDKIPECTGTQAETCRTSPDIDSRKRKTENNEMKDEASEVKKMKLLEEFE